MIRRLGICFLILFSSLQALAVEAVVSHSVFYKPDPAMQNRLTPSIEIYWQINPATVHYTTNAEKMIIARIRTDIIFTNETGVTAEDHFILQTVPRSTLQELSAQSIIDLRRYFVKPGMTKVKFTLTDMGDSTHRFVYADSFMVAPAANTGFYSDIQLLDTILQSTTQTAFYKNGQQQVPACINFLDDGKNTLHYYVELYKTTDFPKTSYPLRQKIFITRKESDPPMANFLKTDTLRNMDLLTTSGSFKIATLTSGNYYLYTILEDNKHNLLASANLFFQRLNLHPAPEDTATAKIAPLADTGIESINVINLNKTFVAKYSAAEVRAILKMLLPVSDASGVKAINGFLKKPDDIYMRYFIYNHFANIDKKDPGHAWKEYSAKVKEVNRLFTARGVAGYETERGFMYLRYGAPTEIVTVENEPGTLPYEVWQYDVLTEMSQKDIANAVFLFYKPSQMMSDYKLLHTTVSGEVRNTQWRLDLYNGDQGGKNMNSRAEQYIGNR